MRDFEVVIEYPGSPEQIWQLLNNPGFLEFRWTQMPKIHCQVRVEPAGARTWATRAKVDIAQMKASSPYGKLLPDQLIIEVVEDWGDNLAPGLVAQGEFRVRLEKVPLRVQAETTLEPAGGDKNKTLRRVNGNISVDIPFIGGKVEREILSYLQDLARGEEDAAARWLAQ